MENNYNKILDILKRKKIKITEVRVAILKTFSTKEHVNIHEIVENVKNTLGFVNVMSIYNNIDMLLKNNLLLASTNDGKKITYELASDEMIHIKCEECSMLKHDKNSLSNEILDAFRSIAKKFDVEAEHFKVEIHGICKDCKSKLAKNNEKS